MVLADRDAVKGQKLASELDEQCVLLLLRSLGALELHVSSAVFFFFVHLY